MQTLKTLTLYGCDYLNSISASGSDPFVFVDKGSTAETKARSAGLTQIKYSWEVPVQVETAVNGAVLHVTFTALKAGNFSFDGVVAVYGSDNKMEKTTIKAISLSGVGDTETMTLPINGAGAPAYIKVFALASSRAPVMQLYQKTL